MQIEWDGGVFVSCYNHHFNFIPTSFDLSVILPFKRGCKILPKMIWRGLGLEILWRALSKSGNSKRRCQNLQILLGGYETETGEQWLVFRNDGGYSAADYAKFAEGLWRRAAASGAMDLIQKRAFEIADDIYGAGLLFAYLAFVPFCGTRPWTAFRYNYCLEDDRLLEAVRFLDLGDGAGWELIQAMLNSDYRKRPVASTVLNHRFLTGVVLGEGTKSRQWL
ncbi:hypothetical protein AKJ16_DCAP11220 [Drosera capensis]